MMTIKALLRGSLLPVAISVISVAQSWPLASGMEMATSASGSGSLHDHGRSRAVFLSGKVVVDEGNAPSAICCCRNELRRSRTPKAIPMRRGYFSFQLCAAGSLLSIDVQEVGMARASHRRTSEHPGSPNKVAGVTQPSFLVSAPCVSLLTRLRTT
jgi:hypothetical protein